MARCKWEMMYCLKEVPVSASTTQGIELHSKKARELRMKEEERMSPEDREEKDRRRWEKFDELYGRIEQMSAVKALNEVRANYWLNIGEKIKKDKEEGK